MFLDDLCDGRAVQAMRLAARLDADARQRRQSDGCVRVGCMGVVTVWSPSWWWCSPGCQQAWTAAHPVGAR